MWALKSHENITFIHMNEPITAFLGMTDEEKNQQGNLATQSQGTFMA